MTAKDRKIPHRPTKFFFKAYFNTLSILKAVFLRLKILHSLEFRMS